MNKLYTLLFFCFAVFCHSQNVTFTDIEFKNYLVNAVPADSAAKDTAGNWVAVDTNGDGEIQISEALQIKFLRVIPPAMITSVEGIKSFSTADSLELDNLEMIDALDLSNMPSLKKVSAQGNIFLQSFNVSGSTLLESIAVSGGNIPTINLSGLPLLKNVTAGNNSTSINFTGSTSIENLNLSGNMLSALDLQLFPNLKNVDVTGNFVITTLNASGLNQLLTLRCGFNSLTNLNVQNTPLLNLIEAGNNNLTTLDVSSSPQLKFLRLNDNQLTHISLISNPLLEDLILSYNYLTLLDLHANGNLVIVEADTNELQTLIIKNGIVDEIYYEDNPDLIYICADDSETAALVANNTAMGLTNCVVNSYCTFTPGGTYYTVAGSTRFDSDANGCDTADLLLPNQKFAVTSGATTNEIIGNITGNYAIPIMSGTHTITPVLENPSYFIVTPSTLTVDFPTQTSPVNQNFCVSANGNHNDLETAIIPMNDSVPGYNVTYKIIFRNKGTTVQSGNLALSYDDSVINFVNADVVPTSQSAGTLTWNFTNLAPFELDEVFVTFALNAPTATPPLNSGDILTFTAVITAGTDETPADNTFVLNETVVNSFDPNDKTCLEGASITQTEVGDYVHYLIRFENNGTANAQNIVVKDVIDTSKFDLNSLVVMNTSHNAVTKITAPNTIEFIFENIQLPFDDATNDGFIMFKIKTKATLVLGDSFSNTANIYFDYNFPITTNTVTTTVQNNLSTSEAETESSVILYPNPVKEVLYFKSAEKVKKAELFDMSGRIISVVAVQNNSANLADLKAGTYVIKIHTKDTVIVSKIIKR